MEPRIDKLLDALGHRERLRVVGLLLDGPMREDDLRRKLGIRSASTASRHLDRLDAERLVGQDEQRGERYLTLEAETRAFVQHAADFTSALSKAQAEVDRRYTRALRKEGFANGVERQAGG